MSISHVQPGDSVKSLYNRTRNANRFIDAANAVNGLSSRFNSPLVSPNNGQIRVQLKNSTGGDLNALQIGGIKTALLTDSRVERKTITLEIEEPAATSTGIAITETPIKDGQFGWGYIGGVSHCKIDVTDAGHTHASLKNGTSVQLESGASGEALIIWKESGTGTKNAVVQWPVANAISSPPSGATSYLFSSDQYRDNDTFYTNLPFTNSGLISTEEHPTISDKWLIRSNVDSFYMFDVTAEYEILPEQPTLDVEIFLECEITGQPGVDVGTARARFANKMDNSLIDNRVTLNVHGTCYLTDSAVNLNESLAIFHRFDEHGDDAFFVPTLVRCDLHQVTIPTS